MIETRRPTPYPLRRGRRSWSPPEVRSGGDAASYDTSAPSGVIVPGGLEAPLPQVPDYCEAPLSARTLGGRQGASPFPTIAPEAPATEDPGLAPPAAQRLRHGIHAQRGPGNPPDVPRATGLILVGQALGQVTPRPLRDDALAQRFFHGALDVAWGPPARRQLADHARQRLTRPFQRRPQCRPRGFAEPHPSRLYQSSLAAACADACVVRSTSGGRPGWRAARWGARAWGEKGVYNYFYNTPVPYGGETTCAS